MKRKLDANRLLYKIYEKLKYTNNYKLQKSKITTKFNYVLYLLNFIF